MSATSLPAKINEFKSLSIRATNLLDVWNSKELTFNAARAQIDISGMKTALYVEVINYIELLKADMQETHIKYFVDEILDNYGYLTISDITTFFRDLISNWKSFAKPTMLDLISKLKEYDIQRAEFAVEQRTKESNKHKADVKDFDMKKVYKRLKAEAKKPKVTQKEKDKKMLDEYSKKLEQLQKMYSPKKLKL